MSNFRYSQARARSLTKIWCFTVIMCVSAVVTTFSSLPLPVPILTGTLGLYSFLFFALPSIRDHGSIIVPYFQARLPEPGADTFGHGKKLANSIDEIDRWLASQGESTLSSFGYRDSERNSECDWHDPAVGIRVVNKMRESCKEDWMDQEMREELSAIATALKLAHEAEVAFCFHMRWGGFSWQELDLREGSYF